MNDRIKKLRKEYLKLSQKAFGEKIGLSESAISNIEKGRYNLTDPIKKLICSTWNVNKMWIDTGEGDVFNSDRSAELAYLVGALLAEDDEFKTKFISGLLKLDRSFWINVEEFINGIYDNKKDR